MAQSTTIINAKALYLSAGGTDISGSIAGITLAVDDENAQHYTADGGAAFSLVGKYRWGGTVNIYYSETSSEAYDVMVAAREAGTTLAMIASVAGNNMGDETLSGSIYVVGMPYAFDSTSPDAVLMSVPFIGTGALTRGTAS